jgi:pilus assembly protein CpaF
VNPLQVSDLVELKSLTQPMAQMLQALAHAKINVLVSGGTGSGRPRCSTSCPVSSRKTSAW